MPFKNVSYLGRKDESWEAKANSRAELSCLLKLTFTGTRAILMTGRPSQQPLKFGETPLLVIRLPRIKKCAAVNELRTAASLCVHVDAHTFVPFKIT